MKLKNIWLLMTFVLVAITMSYEVESAACSSELCTPTCEFVYPSSDNLDLVADTSSGNTTMVAMVKEGTTSGFYNVTSYTINPYHNSTSTQNTSENSLGPIIFSDLDDGTYTLGATIYYDNTSTQYQNLTTTQVACSSRQFFVETKEGTTVPQTTIIAEKETKKVDTIALLLILVIAIALIFKDQIFKK